jgi:Antitoxin VbhA
VATTPKTRVPSTSPEVRKRGIAEAIHSLEMEGLAATPESRTDAKAFVEGAIDGAEMVRRAQMRLGLQP